MTASLIPRTRTELAPGATFYAQGLAVKIDAIEIDQGESNIETWQICPKCGWLGIHAAGLPVSPVASCPRCHTGANNTDEEMS